MELTTLFQFVSEVGFPIAIAVVGGVFAINALKYVFNTAIMRIDGFGVSIANVRDDIHAVQKQVVDVDESITDLLVSTDTKEL